MDESVDEEYDGSLPFLDLELNPSLDMSMAGRASRFLPEPVAETEEEVPPAEPQAPIATAARRLPEEHSVAQKLRTDGLRGILGPRESALQAEKDGRVWRERLENAWLGPSWLSSYGDDVAKLAAVEGQTEEKRNERAQEMQRRTLLSQINTHNNNYNQRKLTPGLTAEDRQKAKEEYERIYNIMADEYRREFGMEPPAPIQNTINQNVIASPRFRKLYAEYGENNLMANKILNNEFDNDTARAFAKTTWQRFNNDPNSMADKERVRLSIESMNETDKGKMYEGLMAYHNALYTIFRKAGGRQGSQALSAATNKLNASANEIKAAGAALTMEQSDANMQRFDNAVMTGASMGGLLAGDLSEVVANRPEYAAQIESAKRVYESFMETLIYFYTPDQHKLFNLLKIQQDKVRNNLDAEFTSAFSDPIPLPPFPEWHEIEAKPNPYNLRLRKFDTDGFAEPITGGTTFKSIKGAVDTALGRGGDSSFKEKYANRKGGGKKQ